MSFESAARSLERAHEEHACGSGSTFVQHVNALLERTEYRRAERGEDLEDIYRLRYKAYRMNDVVPDDESRTIHDDLDEVSNVHNFGVYVDQILVSTLRVHHVTLATPWSASTKTFPDILYPMLERGMTFVCMNRFASDPDWSRSLPQLPYVTLRLASMASLHFDVPYGLSTVREDHGAFYRRVFDSEMIAPGRPYPGFVKKVALYRTEAHRNRNRFFARFPFFRSTEFERRMLFAKPQRGELPPLTILPTAKFLPHAA